MKNIFILSVITLFFFVSCSPKTIAPTKEAPLENNLVQGKQIFENSCSKCHDLPKPAQYSSTEWVKIMNAMAPKAKLSKEQHQLVFNYVSTVK